MADVTVPSRREDRGQMLLITGFGLAVMLVALALILNTAIFTENVATRGSDIVGGKDAAQYRDAVEESGNELVRHVNYNNNTTYPEQQASVSSGVTSMDSAIASQQALGGRYTEVSLTSQSKGVRLYQNSPGNFTNHTSPSGDVKANWRLVESANGIRDFEFTIDNTSLAISSSNAFFVNLTGSSGTVRKVYMYNDVDGGFVVEVRNKSGSEVGSCKRTVDTEVNVSVTGATIEGDRCPALEIFDALDTQYEVTFNNTRDPTLGDTIAGTWSMVVNNSSDLETTANFAGFSDYGNPDIEPAVYSLVLDIKYDSPRLSYRTRLRIAPGEPT